MSQAAARLQISTAPFVQRGLSTRRLMYEVLAALVLVTAAATWFFGVAALLLVAVGTASAMLAEWLLIGGGRRTASLFDGSAALTGALLALTLPPGTPLWMAALGSFVGVALGKASWGGVGRKRFDPALVGRAFLQAAFPLTLTTWIPQPGSWSSLPARTLALPFGSGGVDATTVATPLGLAKFDGQFTELVPLLSGRVPGSLGETAGALLLLCGAWLALRRVFDWRLMVSTLASAGALASVFWLVDSTRYPGPLFMVCSGGLLFGAVFMVTDPVTTPLTPKGMWIFGAGVGVLVVLIRLFGGLPEGVMYAILLMNAVTPLINRATQPRRFGV